MGSDHSSSKKFDASEKTKALRPDIDLTNEQIDNVRRMRKDGHEFDYIEKRLGITNEQAKLAAANLRTRRDSKTRLTINVPPQVHEYIKNKKDKNETMGEALARLINVDIAL